MQGSKNSTPKVRSPQPVLTPKKLTYDRDSINDPILN